MSAAWTRWSYAVDRASLWGSPRLPPGVGSPPFRGGHRIHVHGGDGAKPQGGHPLCWPETGAERAIPVRRHRVLAAVYRAGQAGHSLGAARPFVLSGVEHSGHSPRGHPLARARVRPVSGLCPARNIRYTGNRGSDQGRQGISGNGGQGLTTGCPTQGVTMVNLLSGGTGRRGGPGWLARATRALVTDCLTRECQAVGLHRRASARMGRMRGHVSPGQGPYGHHYANELRV